MGQAIFLKKITCPIVALVALYTKAQNGLLVRSKLSFKLPAWT